MAAPCKLQAASCKLQAASLQKDELRGGAVNDCFVFYYARLRGKPRSSMLRGFCLQLEACRLQLLRA
ncbi:MAG: hypothetical protein CMK74_10570 [Pseudomonadales bacterium]|nr:hypothetical protein [Pseudomonadales bacterium]